MITFLGVVVVMKYSVVFNFLVIFYIFIFGFNFRIRFGKFWGRWCLEIIRDEG